MRRAVLVALLGVGCGGTTAPPDAAESTDSGPSDSSGMATGPSSSGGAEPPGGGTSDGTTSALDTTSGLDTTAEDTGESTGLPDTGPANPLPPGDHHVEIVTADGRDRIYELHVPPGLPEGEPAPVVLALHGGGGSAEGARYDTGLDATSDANGFLLVYPQGILDPDSPGMLVNATWNATSSCCGEALEQQVDDVAYMRQLVDDLQERVWVDTQRVYATGISNGGQMSYRLACEAADVFAAVASVGAPGEDWSTCTPARPISVMTIQGQQDPCAVAAGGTCGGCFQQYINAVFGTNLEPITYPCPATVEVVDDWRALGDCAARSEVSHQQGGATCTAWACQNKTEVVHCDVDGMGHTWPNGEYLAVCESVPNGALCQEWINTVGPITADLSNDEIWSFFAGHTL
ncbi:MAG: PHB depolymerase family esterase [Myxococcota bacterium]